MTPGLQTFVETLATLAFAMSGLLAAARKGLDAVGTATGLRALAIATGWTLPPWRSEGR